MRFFKVVFPTLPVIPIISAEEPSLVILAKLFKEAGLPDGVLNVVNGDKEVGPNAVLAFKREGYKNSDISVKDMVDYLTYSGFLSFVGKNFKFCLNEFSTSFLKSSFLKKTQKLIPEIRSKDINKGPAGVRAQGIDTNGDLMMDFNVITEGKQIHVINAPSPAATCSLSIADHIIDSYIN